MFVAWKVGDHPGTMQEDPLNTTLNNHARLTNGQLRFQQFWFPLFLRGYDMIISWTFNRITYSCSIASCITFP